MVYYLWTFSLFAIFIVMFYWVWWFFEELDCDRSLTLFSSIFLFWREVDLALELTPNGREICWFSWDVGSWALQLRWYLAELQVVVPDPGPCSWWQLLCLNLLGISAFWILASAEVPASNIYLDRFLSFDCNSLISCSFSCSRRSRSARSALNSSYCRCKRSLC